MTYSSEDVVDIIIIVKGGRKYITRQSPYNKDSVEVIREGDNFDNPRHSVGEWTKTAIIRELTMQSSWIHGGKINNVDNYDIF